MREERLGRIDAHITASRVWVSVMLTFTDEALLLPRWRRSAGSGKGSEGLSILPLGSGGRVSVQVMRIVRDHWDHTQWHSSQGNEHGGKSVFWNFGRKKPLAVFGQ